MLFDSGIRSGADIVKALALGADARSAIGRPYAYGLALGGATASCTCCVPARRGGSDHGCRRLSVADDLTPDTLRRVS